ncbi:MULTISPECIES: AzlC family ABC transporter permease [Burkholderia]|uniref:AzlC family ABC transporter permease n=1 Tax=Burkholderia sola TaxID=2843302 RepID=A0ABV2CIJ8_9BURK|nr:MULTISPECIES: AzlC family ABC transporter permease [Burkholderia]KWU29203.1 branched-chain amino acid ABC transporter permease [Burkholderia cenocepacia]MBP0610970.1 AzlC family ABC transporter permease [Burkholderia sp. CpTa8-5]MBP0716801.1 AzlC family ABC transporter permease [Burkholderia sp. AcTa6-5]OXI75883.1 branched-chain amino acid ABC transporter permease [Burkholderia sp. AU31280]QRR12874.1 branched-chain amino acid ABC transporter permease [Burkholderia sp. MS389]
MEERYLNETPASPPRRPLNEWLDGARDTIPMMIGAAPFGVIFGTLVGSGPLAAWHGALMSLAVFAGSAQFIALGLIAGSASFAVVLATTLIVNLRHLLYSATLAPYVAHLPLRWRATLGALMTDEVFAVAYGHYRHYPPGTIGPHYFFGSGLAMYLNWQVWTLAGIGFGTAFPGLQSLGLDFAMAATFIAIVVPQLGTLRYFAAAATAGTLAYFWQGWPYKLGLLGAVAAGVAIGVVLTLRHDRTRARSRPEAAS